MDRYRVPAAIAILSGTALAFALVVNATYGPRPTNRASLPGKQTETTEQRILNAVYQTNPGWKGSASVCSVSCPPPVGQPYEVGFFLQVPRRVVYNDQALSGDVRLTGSITESNPQNSKASTDAVTFQAPALDQTLAMVNKRIGTDSALNLDADLSRALDPVANQKDSKLVGQAWLVRARLCLDAHRPKMALKAISAAEPAVAAHPELKTTYSALVGLLNSDMARLKAQSQPDDQSRRQPTNRASQVQP